MLYFLCFMAGGFLGFLGAAIMCAAGRDSDYAEKYAEEIQRKVDRL